MKAVLKIKIETSRKILESIYKALYPETLNLPSTECSAELSLNNSLLLIKILCSRVNLLRAVTNSYLGLISTIINAYEEIENG